MKNLIYYISFFFLGLFANAQTALYNSGNLRVHENGQLGFHTNLINDAAFDENLGLVGFYGEDLLEVSGAFMPIFYDSEIANQIGVLLNVPVSTTNNTNFIVGDIITPRNQRDVYFSFLQDAFYVGESNASKIDGFSQINNRQAFTFPVGDSQQLRPLILNSEDLNTISKCAYFFDNPNTPDPDDFQTTFSTDAKPARVGEISTVEFWALEGSVSSTVTLSWNERSNLAALTDDVNTVIVVGWNKTRRQWLSLGNIAMGGDLSQGFVTSDSFIPDEYDIITIGNVAVPKELLELDNFIVTPNGDGINDVLIIPELEQSPNNILRIYNRLGLKVFEMENYTNQFNGISTTGNVLYGRDNGLPTGVYFYTVSMFDLGLEFQGFLYLTRQP